MRLNKEQEKLAQNGAMGHALIRGIAGSGKTTVGVRRLFYLIETCCKTNDTLLFLTYNRSLCDYVRHIYDTMAKDMGVSYKGRQVQVKTVDALAYHYFKESTKEKPLEVVWRMPDMLFQEALDEARNKYPECKLLTSEHKRFLCDEMNWMKGCGYVSLERYQQADRIGRCAGSTGEDSRKLQKNSMNREAIFYLMHRIQQVLAKRQEVDSLTMNHLALDYLRSQKEHTTYKHIIIDEAQDLTRVQLEIIAQLRSSEEDSSLLFLMDVAQSIYPHAWLVKGRTFKSIGYDMTGKGYRLSKNYRTTTQISQCAYSLLANDLNVVEDTLFVKPSLIERHGDYPVYRHFKDSKEQNDYVVKLIKVLKKNYSLKDIAIVSKLNKTLELIQPKLQAQGIPSILFKTAGKGIDFSKEEVKLLTMHSVKGLEFKVVILIDLNKDVIPYYQKGLSEEEQQEDEWMERKLLYVGMTRAQDRLFMCSYGEASKFMGEIDKKFLSMQVGCKMNALYPIPYEDYLYQEQLADKHHKEESIRQWILSELIHTYGYPQKLITIEYPVRNFSKTGKVDIAIINERTQTPHLFVEVKHEDIPLEEAIDQLKSYMHVAKVKYGMATNGKSIVFLDQDMNRIKDLPVCDHQLFATSLETFQYIDKKTQQSYTFTRDHSLGELILEDDVVEKEALHTLPIYADVAAGVPIEIMDEAKGRFSLPKAWTKEKDSLYMLQVKGDSMIGVAIEDGDYVVIDPSQEVRTHEIGVVYYNGASTIKRIVPMGDSVLLMSENPAYEPIQISEGDFQVQGKLVGVVKKIL